ncbi:uncharacterized protein ASCRUDRAFT_89942 [Ascoidea rubescens DSM 1968]|uniref:VWFA domain-containing protein n=1 Tax=Ascoidea rubescens DSM 1968 TaxID=1344418 RepID=A0A1D2VMT8_9ASCO|nr:hypothetical protein ASCRUDRAFT_89942 [Ascoidea rubescens DSM 1968]ODV62928.1 hypothetical protein ASCRUDRAFT_89942 [Ascoidea rubescens DSM 1968]
MLFPVTSPYLPHLSQLKSACRLVSLSIDSNVCDDFYSNVVIQQVYKISSIDHVQSLDGKDGKESANEPNQYQFTHPVQNLSSIYNFKFTIIPLDNSKKPIVIESKCYLKAKAEKIYDEIITNDKSNSIALTTHLTDDAFDITLGNMPLNCIVKVDLKYDTILKYDNQYNAFRYTIPLSVHDRYNSNESPSIDASDNDATDAKNPIHSLTENDHKILSSLLNIQTPNTVSISTKFINKIKKIKCVSSHVLNSNDTFVNTDQVSFSHEFPNFGDRNVIFYHNYNIFKDYTLIIYPNNSISSHLSSALSNNFEIPSSNDLLSKNFPYNSCLALSVLPEFNNNLAPSNSSIVKKQIIFLLDRSGSMYGSPIALLKDALNLFIASFPFEDNTSINLVSFGSDVSSLWGQSKPITSQSIHNEIKQYTDSILADMGGTEILKAIKKVNSLVEDFLKKNKPTKNVNQFIETEVILLTDGEVWNIDQVESEINTFKKKFSIENKNKTFQNSSIRYFSIGVGDSVSHDLVDKISLNGDGYSQYIQSDERMELKIIKMLNSVLSSSLTYAQITFKNEISTIQDNKSKNKNDIDDDDYILIELNNKFEKNLSFSNVKNPNNKKHKSFLNFDFNKKSNDYSIFPSNFQVYSEHRNTFYVFFHDQKFNIKNYDTISLSYLNPISGKLLELESPLNKEPISPKISDLIVRMGVKEALKDDPNNTANGPFKAQLALRFSLLSKWTSLLAVMNEKSEHFISAAQDKDDLSIEEKGKFIDGDESDVDEKTLAEVSLETLSSGISRGFNPYATYRSRKSHQFHMLSAPMGAVGSAVRTTSISLSSPPPPPPPGSFLIAFKAAKPQSAGLFKRKNQIQKTASFGAQEQFQSFQLQQSPVLETDVVKKSKGFSVPGLFSFGEKSTSKKDSKKKKELSSPPVQFDYSNDNNNNINETSSFDLSPAVRGYETPSFNSLNASINNFSGLSSNEKLIQLVKNQQFDGSFKICSADILEEIIKVSKTPNAKKESFKNDPLKLTALIVKYLSKELLDIKDLWGAVIKKAMVYIEKSLSAEDSKKLIDDI